MKEKSLFNNYIYNVIYTALNILFPLITTPYISRVLLADGVGKVSLAENIASYFIMIASLGIPNYAVREIAKVQNHKNKRDKVFSEIIIINTISTIICSVAYYIMIFKINYFQDKLLLYSVSGIAVILNLFNVDWFYKGMEEYGYITLRSVVIKIISLIMMLIFVRNRESYIIYAFIHCVATAGNNIFNCINIRKYVKLSLNNIDCLIHIKSVIILLFTQISVELYTKVDTTMIGFINGDENVGYYANSMKLIKLIVSVLTALGAILLPRLSKYYNENRNVEFDMMVNKALKVIFVLCIPCMSGVYLLSDNIILLIFGKSFLPAITTMRILSILIPIYSVGNLYGSQLLMILGQEKKLMYSVMIGTVVNVILNSFFIVIWKQNGAAFASLITELCVLIAQINLVKSYIKWDSFKRLINTTIISDIGMMIAIIIIKCFINSDILQILFSVVIGSITYFLINMLLKNEAIIEIKKVILNKILIISERKRYI